MQTINAPAATATWTIDPDHSHVGFAVKHLMIATVKGRFTDVTGALELDEEDITRSRVVAEIRVDSIDTKQRQRDAHLRSPDFFDAERFPLLTFRSRRVERSEHGLKVAGDLTIRDITREVVLDVEQEGRGLDEDGVPVTAFSAHTRIDRTDFGLTWNMALETGGVLVGNEVKINLELLLKRQ